MPQSHQQRVATLYLPFISIILENKHRLIPSDSNLNQTTNNNTPAPSSLATSATESSKSSSLPRDASLR